MIPLKVGPVVINTKCHVLDLEFPYNILFGRPFIHTLKAVPSTYHQCLKFPHQGREATILGDPNPFEFCKRLEGTPMNFCPINEFAKIIPQPLTIKEPSPTILPEVVNEDSNSRKGKGKVDDVKTNTIVKKVTFSDMGIGEYKFENALCVGQLPLSPQSFGKPSQISPSTNKDTMHVNKTAFEHWGSLSDEHMEDNILDWLYFDGKDEPVEFEGTPHY